VALLLAFTASLLAVPARRGWQQHAMADGSVVEIQQWGDEFYHFYQTRDGQLALPQSDGRFVLTDEKAPSASQVAARRAASPLRRMPQTVGTVNLAPRGLVILVSYADLAYQSINTQEAMDSMMNVAGYDYNGATGSVRDYFIAQSDSAYQPVFDVVGPVTLSQNRAYYGTNGSNGSDKLAYQMIIDACQAVDDQVDFTRYDNDNNGEIDFVYVLYAGIGENDKNSVAESVWPHNWYVYSGAGKSIYLDGKRLNNYACSGEIDGVSGKRNAIGTLAHEFGHVIGLPDYYDTAGGTNWTDYLTPNDWSIMDQGCYNNDGKTPPNYSVFDKYFIGWATPEILKAGDSINVTLTTDYNCGYQITGGTELLPCTTANTIIYYIENRQQVGWDAGLSGHGMIVWKVNYNASAWAANTPNNVYSNMRYQLMAADGSAMIGLVPGESSYAHTGATDAFPGTANITSYTPTANCAMTDITESGDTIYFKYNGGRTIPVDPTAIDRSSSPWGGDRGRLILRDGQIIIVRDDKQYNIIGTQIKN